MDPMTKLDEASERYREAKDAFEDARTEAVMAVVDALRAGERPTVVTNRSPFTAAYVRRIARDNGIEGDPRYVREAKQ
jgi:transposase InsO family protein